MCGVASWSRCGSIYHGFNFFVWNLNVISDFTKPEDDRKRVA